MPNQITIDLPPDIPPPKFKLFEEVYYHGDKGTVTATCYCCALEALAEGLPRYGWEYDVSYIFGKTPGQALNAGGRAIDVPERCLSACLPQKLPQPPAVAASPKQSAVVA